MGGGLLSEAPRRRTEEWDRQIPLTSRRSARCRTRSHYTEPARRSWPAFSISSAKLFSSAEDPVEHHSENREDEASQYPESFP